MAGCVLSLPKGQGHGWTTSCRCFPLNDAIIIRGARTHNLKEHLLRDSPREADGGQRCVGSGKSSLASTPSMRGTAAVCRVAFVVCSAVPGADRKTDVDLIDGLAPANRNQAEEHDAEPALDVATATEIYDYLRLLYARCGTVHCVFCDGW